MSLKLNSRSFILIPFLRNLGKRLVLVFSGLPTIATLTLLLKQFSRALSLNLSAYSKEVYLETRSEINCGGVFLT